MSEENVIPLEKKTIEIKLGKVRTQFFINSLNKAAQTPTLSGAMIYKLKKQLRKAKEEIEVFNEAQMAVIDDMGKKDSEGNLIPDIHPLTQEVNYNVKPENIRKFQLKIKEMDEAVVVFDQIKFADLGTAHKLDAFDLEQLDFIVE